jgi:hypothetical protein
MDITVPPAVSELARQAREFIAEVVIGVEEETGGRVISQRRHAIEGGEPPRFRRFGGRKETLPS